MPYRSIRFEFENYSQENFQETAQINYVDSNVLYTRVVEHKQLSGQFSKTTTISKEFPQLEGEPFYPIPNEMNKNLYLKYKKQADKLDNTIFCGRLAEYQYFNMDQVVANCLIKFADLF